jgi:multiple sugar transport system substrate-binding protein
MTWSDPRGLDPMLATAARWHELHPAVEVIWEARSLQDFESYPVAELAARFDLMVIDHPHVGQVVREGVLVPLDRHLPAETIAVLERQSVGPSLASYRWEGHLWALPVDASTQVQAIRPDRLERGARSWDEVEALGRDGRLLWPLRAPHALMAFLSLAANGGTPCGSASDRLLPREDGLAVLDRLIGLVALVDPACLALDPIQGLDRLARDERAACIPLVYAYRNYQVPGYRAQPLRFVDIPGERGPLGSTLGGTGIAVSARSGSVEAAVAHAAWLASGEVQRDLYARAGGQPGNALAWDDPVLDREHHGFYRGIRATLDGAWVRPRHAGWMGFQDRGDAILREALTREAPPAACLDALDAAWRASLAAA